MHEENVRSDIRVMVSPTVWFMSSTLPVLQKLRVPHGAYLTYTVTGP